MFDFYKYTFVRFHSYVKSYIIPSLSLSLSLSVCIDESNGGDLYQTCRTKSMERARQIDYNFRMVMWRGAFIRYLVS